MTNAFVSFDGKQKSNKYRQICSKFNCKSILNQFKYYNILKRSVRVNRLWAGASYIAVPIKIEIKTEPLTNIRCRWRNERKKKKKKNLFYFVIAWNCARTGRALPSGARGRGNSTLLRRRCPPFFFFFETFIKIFYFLARRTCAFIMTYRLGGGTNIWDHHLLLLLW